MKILELKSLQKNVGKITVMCFIEPIVRFNRHSLLEYVHLFVSAKIILLDTIYLLKFLQSCFYSIICTPKYYIFLKS